MYLLLIEVPLFDSKIVPEYAEKTMLSFLVTRSVPDSNSYEFGYEAIGGSAFIDPLYSPELRDQPLFYP